MTEDGHLRVQLSPLRRGRITGSRIAAALAKDKYKSQRKVLIDMVREWHGLPDLFQGNEATDYGHAHEPDAIRAYEEQELCIVHGAQDIVIHPFYDFLAVTPDGLVGTDGAVECKCPIRAVYTHIDQRPDYELQCRLILECTGRRWIDFVVWRDGQISVSRVHYDPDWLPSVLPKLQKFMAKFEAMCQDEELLALERGRGQQVEVSAREQFLADRERWQELQRQEVEIGLELSEIKARVAEVLGNAEIATVDGVPAARMQYRDAPSVFDRAAFRQAYADLEEQFSKPGKATRYPVLITEKEPA